ncbi:methyltransferase type 12 domain [Candidatus Symbiothrix dinenymphae]|nr:methyltransferase type 12 domain [Candidatus Symbiothrix dinenymphae]
MNREEYTLQDFLDIEGQKNVIQAKFLETSLSEITPEEIVKFNNLLHFYMQRGNNTLEQIVDKYLNLVSFIMEDQRYFVEYGKYRFSTFAEVENYYKDFNYMDSYTVGLGLSTYLWPVHREMMRLFRKYLIISNMCEGWRKYLEIGPGHGEYLTTAMQQTNFKQYIAVDISKTSIDLTSDYIQHTMPETDKSYKLIHEDIFKYQTQDLFDMIVMGEVLEHVENPTAFLHRAYQLASNEAYIFITTAINAPTPDHIYLFNNLKEVTDMLEKAGFSIVDYVAANTNNVPLEKAEKRKIPIVCGFILKKKNT